MINRIIFFFLLGSITFSCKENEKMEINYHHPFTAEKNGSIWVTSNSGANYYKNTKSFYLYGTKVIKKDLEEHLSLGFDFDISEIMVPKTITDFNPVWTNIGDGDVIFDSYSLNLTGDNYITITSLDTIHKTISGIYSAQLKRNNFETGEIINLSHGIFNLNYQVLKN